VSFAAITVCVASQRVIPKASIYFVIDSVRKLLDTLSYTAEERVPCRFKALIFVYNLLLKINIFVRKLTFLLFRSAMCRGRCPH
jgi:hypothetical protein